MNTLNRLCHHHLDPEVHGAQGRMLAAGALSIGLPGDNEVRQPGIPMTRRSLGESRIRMFKYVLGIALHIGPQFQPWSGRHNMVRGDFVAYLDGRDTGDGIAQRIRTRHFADVRTTNHLNVAAIRWWTHQHAVVNIKGVRLLIIRIRLPGRQGIDNLTRQRRKCCGLGTHQQDIRRLRTGASLEVAIRCAQGYFVCARRHGVTDTKPACILKQACTGRNQLVEISIASQHARNLARTGCHPETHRSRDLLAIQNTRHGCQIAIR